MSLMLGYTTISFFSENHQTSAGKMDQKEKIIVFNLQVEKLFHYVCDDQQQLEVYGNLKICQHPLSLCLVKKLTIKFTFLCYHHRDINLGHVLSEMISICKILLFCRIIFHYKMEIQHFCRIT